MWWCEQLLHRPLFDGFLFGDGPIQTRNKGIYITQGGGDGFLFGEGWGKWEFNL